MARLLALNALFFLVPFVVYAGWLLVNKRSFRDPKDWTARSITILSAIGAAAVLIGLIVLVSFETGGTDDVYIPAQLGEDGEIIPGRFENR